ncbi:MAG: hypothetical protein ACI9VN_000222, partial [Patescibacteria group bacterium]
DGKDAVLGLIIEISSLDFFVPFKLNLKGTFVW